MQLAVSIPEHDAPPPCPLRAQPWDIDPRGFREVQRSLNFDYFKWDLFLNGTCRVLPESIVLSRDAHAFLVGAAEAFAALMRRFEAAARRDPSLIEALGIDPALSPLLAAESEHEPAFGRADFFLTPGGGWMLSEFNEDAPGGFNEAVGLYEILDESRLGGSRAGALKERLCDAFSACDSVGFTFATAFSEDLQHCALLESWLRARGHETVRAAPDTLRRGWRGVTLGGRRVQGLFRFYPGEWLGLLDNREHWARALPRLALMNPPVRLLSQSKKSFGLWRDGEGIDDTGRALARRHCPVTEPFDAAQTDRYRREREDLVLKHAFGRMGDAVVMGALAGAREWDEALAFAATRPREFAIQQRFHVQPLEFAAGAMYPTIGVYTVNGRFAGYYSRVAACPFITHEAYHVATVLEAA